MGHAVSQEAEDEPYPDAGPADDGLAEGHLRIDDDAFEQLVSGHIEQRTTGLPITLAEFCCAQPEAWPVGPTASSVGVAARRATRPRRPRDACLSGPVPIGPHAAGVLRRSRATATDRT